MTVNQWQYHLDIRDVWKAPDLSFTEQCDIIVKRIQSSKWYLDSVAENSHCELKYAVEELSDTKVIRNGSTGCGMSSTTLLMLTVAGLISFDESGGR